MTDSIELGPANLRYLERGYTRAFGLSSAQGPLLRAIARALGLSLSELFDEVMTRYLADEWKGMAWPSVSRRNRRPFHKVGSLQRMRVHAVQLNAIQEAALQTVLRRRGSPDGKSGFSQLVEDAFAHSLPLLVERITLPDGTASYARAGTSPDAQPLRWPHSRRKRTA